MNIKIISPEAKKVLTLAREKYWGFRVLDRVGALEEETYNDGWWLIPTDNSTQIEMARKRIEAIKNSGVRIRQVIIAHEAPKLLCAPKIEQKIEIPWEDIGEAVGVILKVVTAVLTVVMASTGLLLVLGIAAICDPAVIIVLEDGTWVEVVRWYE